MGNSGWTYARSMDRQTPRIAERSGDSERRVSMDSRRLQTGCQLCGNSSGRISSRSMVDLEASASDFMEASTVITVAGKFSVRIPGWLPTKGWSIDGRGYVIYTSRGTSTGIKRGALMHRLVFEHILGRPLLSEEHVHHMDFNKRHNCPGNLVVVPACMNPGSPLRDPITGQFMSQVAWERRYGAVSMRTAAVILPEKSVEDVPDWVTSTATEDTTEDANQSKEYD